MALVRSGPRRGGTVWVNERPLLCGSPFGMALEPQEESFSGRSLAPWFRTGRKRSIKMETSSTRDSRGFLCRIDKEGYILSNKKPPGSRGRTCRALTKQVQGYSKSLQLFIGGLVQRTPTLFRPFLTPLPPCPLSIHFRLTPLKRMSNF